MDKIICTVVFPITPDRAQIYMGRKTKKIGVGKFTGPGGKIEGQESIETCAIRETREEVNLLVKKLEKIAIITFDNSGFLMKVHFFFATVFSGTPQDSKEMVDGQWFNIEKLLADLSQIPLMTADHHFLPLILKGKKIIGHCIYEDDKQEKVGSWKYEEVEGFD